MFDVNEMQPWINSGKQPRISVVTPNYNMGLFLGETIESVLRNLRVDDEYFMIDGGSTDGSVEVIRKYESRLTSWVSEKDHGYADAISKGFARATGDILCWINSGDLLLHGALDVVRQSFEKNNVDMIFGDDFYINEEGRVISYSRGYTANLRKAMLYGGWTPLQDACFWRRDLYERVGGIDANLCYAADYDLFLRMAIHGKTTYAPFVFSAFRRHSGQKSISGSASYQEERNAVRKRELIRAPGRVMSKCMNSLWYGAAIRWRIHVAQRGWQRPDLVGRAISELRSAVYWPSESVET